MINTDNINYIENSNNSIIFMNDSTVVYAVEILLEIQILINELK